MLGTLLGAQDIIGVNAGMFLISWNLQSSGGVRGVRMENVLSLDDYVCRYPQGHIFGGEGV